MEKYPSIQTVFKRNPENNYKTLLMGEYSRPEFEYLKDNLWDFTEKVDGMNIRVIYDSNPLDSSVSFRGRTDKAQLPMDLVERLQELFPLEKFTKLWPPNEEENSNMLIYLYGEGFGAGIQKGGKYLDHKDFVLFDVKMGDWWLKREDVGDVALKMGINIVPYIDTGNLSKLVDLVKSPLRSHWGDFTMEGIVARPIVELYARNGQRIITKLKTKDFENGVTIFGRPVVDSKTGKPITKEDMKDKK